MNITLVQNKKLKKYSQVTLLSSSSLLLAGCFTLSPQGHDVNGTGGNDVMVGTAYEDRFYGSAGADSMDGLGGVDDVRFFDSPTGVNVNLTTGVGKGGHAEGDTFTSTERIIGSDFDDVLTGNDADNLFEGNAGADLIDGKAGSDMVIFSSPVGIEVNLTTGLGKGGHAEGDKYIDIENIVGSAFDDILIGNDGDNKINGASGKDVLDGGKGNDEFKGSGQNEVSGGSGVDRFVFDVSSDSVVLKISILKNDNKIVIEVSSAEYPLLSSSTTLNSVEEYTVINGNGSQTTNIKDIWIELASVEQTKFNDEADFLSWLGNDFGYNYEGL